MASGIRRHLRRAIDVQHFGFRKRGTEALGHVDWQYLSTARPQLQVRHSDIQIRSMLQKSAQLRRNKDEASHSLARQYLQQEFWIAYRVLRNDHVWNARQQGTKNLPDRVHEAQTGLLAANVVGVEGIGPPHPTEPIHGGAVGSLHAFRRSR